MKPWLLELGLACNNGCRFCSLAYRQSKEGGVEPAGESVLAALASGRRGHSSVVLVGGEPTLFDGLAGWVGHARKLGYSRVGLQTNGRRLAYASYCGSLEEAGLTDVDIALHGSRAAMHDYHTRVEGSFKQTISGIREVVRSGLELCVSTTLTRSNYRHLLEILEVLAHLKVESWHLSAVYPAGRADEDFSSLAPAFSMLRPHLEALLIRASDLGIEVLTSGVPTCIAPTNKSDAKWGRGVYGSPCQGCTVQDACPGLSEDYIHAFGWEECKPVEGGEEPEHTKASAQRHHLLGGVGLTHQDP